MCAVLSHHIDLGFFRKCIFQSVGEPIRVGVAEDDDRNCRLGLLLCGRGCMDRIRRCLAIPAALAPAALAVLIALLVARKAAKPVPERIDALDALRPPPIPEWRLGGRREGRAQTDSGECRQTFGCETHSHGSRQYNAARMPAGTGFQPQSANIAKKMSS